MAADGVDDEAPIPPVANGDGVSVMPTTGRVDKGTVGKARTRRQFERAAVVNRGVDGGVVEEGGNIGAEFSIPLGTGGGGVSLALRGDDGVRERRIERRLWPCTTRVSASSAPK